MLTTVLLDTTAQHVTFAVDRFIDAASVVELLDLAVLDRGAPKVLRMDNCPEFIAPKLQDWAEEHKCAQAFIPPSQPWHNGFVESLHNRMRDEVLEDNLFDDVEQARQIIGFWSKRYNDTHPHSSLGYMSPNRLAAQWRKENTTAATQATRSQSSAHTTSKASALSTVLFAQPISAGILLIDRPFRRRYLISAHSSTEITHPILLVGYFSTVANKGIAVAASHNHKALVVSHRYTTLTEATEIFVSF
nr:integrase core domain-containing protein [Corynebacterium timonense]